MKVFIVDDNKNNIRLLQDILEDAAFEVFPFENGFSVLPEAKKLQPDVILLDIMMPELDGFAVCRALKKEPATQDIPVIMVTAKSGGEDVKKALEYGAFDYIKKPINEVEVIARINSALRFKENQDRLKEMAMKDSLTGLYNHALLLELFEKEYAKADRENASISCAMLDIDFFKKINDTYGHAAGDQVLRELAVILSSSVRCGDIVGRYGGEEFGLILPGASADQAYQICERIRLAVAEYQFKLETAVIRITISIGVCAKKPEYRTWKESIQTADKMLYQAKEQGRNRVVLA